MNFFYLVESLRKCIDMGMTYYPDYESVPSEGKLRQKLRRSLFPPSDEEKQWMQLEKCMRCLPQDENTGGFFVATIMKLQEVVSIDGDDNSEIDLNATQENIVKDGGDTGTDTQSKVVREKSVDYFPWDADLYNHMKDIYGIDQAHASNKNFCVRKDKKQDDGPKNDAKTIYYIPTNVKNMLEGDRQNRLKIVTAGVKVFERKNFGNNDTQYRLLQEGVYFLSSFLSKRKISAHLEDFCNLLIAQGSISINSLQQQTQDQLLDISRGTVVFFYKHLHNDFEYIFQITCWKDKTLSVMCNKVESARIKHEMEALQIFCPADNTQH